MDELQYPINVEILRMIGDDVSGNAMLFTISYLREDENTHKLVLSDDLELEKDFKIVDININQRRNVPCATRRSLRPLCVVLSFSQWEKRRKRAHRKVHFFSCLRLQIICYYDQL